MTARPNFLVIGAMKAGTTSLWSDLRHTPGVFVPLAKEPEHLADTAVETDAGRQAYFSLFRSGADAIARGECSTAYTKAPTIVGVAPRARRILGDDLRILYLVRNPIARMWSQYRHEVEVAKTNLDFSEAVDTDGRLFDYSSYAQQLVPWREEFDSERIMVVDFESYVRNPGPARIAIGTFLGLDRPLSEGLATETNDGRTTRRPVRGSVAYGVSRSGLYRKALRPYLGPNGRHWARAAATRLLQPRPPTATVKGLPASSRARLLDLFMSEQEQLEAWGYGPFQWDLAGSLSNLVGKTS